MSLKFSERFSQLEMSGTLAFFAKVQKLRSKGEEIISLVAGELSEDTPVNARQGGIEAIKTGFTRYTLNRGITELRKTVADEIFQTLNVKYVVDEILITSGAKQALYSLIYVTCGSGDEVIIFSPYYVSYFQQIKMCGAKPVIVETKIEDGYQITETALASAVTDKTRMIILNSPNNPTGALLNRESLELVGNYAVENDIWILSDEIYEKIIYPPSQFISPIQLSDKIKERTLLVNGFSKAYAMTGWRIGYCAAQKDIIDAVALVQSHTTSNASSISQKAALSALKSDKDFSQNAVEALIKKRDLAIEILGSIESAQLFEPQGAFYILLDLSKLNFRDSKFFKSNELALYLLENKKVAVVPGASFGKESSLRISFASSLKEIESGCKKLKEGIAELI